MGKILKEHEERLKEIEALIEEHKSNESRRSVKEAQDRIFGVTNNDLYIKISSLNDKLNLLIKTLGYELVETPAKKEFVKTKK